MNQLTLSVHIQGVSLRLQTNSINYTQYLNNYLGHFEQNSSKDPDIEVSLFLEESITVPQAHQWKQPEGLKRIGRRIFVNDNEIVCDGLNNLSNLKLRCIYGLNTQIYAYLSIIKSAYLIKRFYQQVIRKKHFNDYRNDIYAALTYYLIYYPILYKLEQDSLSPLHASAVVYKGRGILIPGLPGVGKSTLCLAFLADKNTKFLSDNIVLYDDNRVFSFFEPLKLDQFGMSLLNVDNNILIKIGSDSYYDRNSYRIAENSLINSMRPDVLLIPMRSSETIINRLSPQHATQMSLDFNNIAGEVNSYLGYASIQNLCHKNENLNQNRIERLRTLYNSIDCYMLSVRTGQPLHDVIKTIEHSW